LNYNIAGTIVKTFNYLIDLYKESFNGRFNDDVNTHNNPSWFYLGKIREGESIYISSKCVSNNLGIIKAWIKITNDTIKYNGVIYKNCQEENLYLINRNEEKIRTIETICYSSSGKVIYDNGQEENETEWLNVPPDSMGEIIYNSACAIFNSKN
jgi:hypothetical protein